MNDFAATAEAIIRARLKDDPIHATLAGIHDYDGELPDITAEGIAQTHGDIKAHLASLARFTPGDLTPAERIDHRLLSSTLEVESRERTELQPEQHDPSLYPSIAAESVYSLLARDFAPLPERLPSIVSRLRGIPAMLAAGTRNLVRSPRIWTEIAIEETAGVVEFFEQTVAPLLEGRSEDRPATDAGRVNSTATDALQAAIAALHAYERFLKERQVARDGMPFAIGRDFFDYKLKHEHFLPYTTETLLAFGENAVRETELRLQEVAALIEPDTGWATLVERLREDHPVEHDLLVEYRRGLAEARGFVVERDLVSIPAGESLEIVETPIFVRPTIPYAAYVQPGVFETRQQGLYYVTPVNEHGDHSERNEQLQGHNRFGMLLTNVHEGYPGHHLQLVIANRAPSLVRRFHDSSVFCEGWALYCEQLVLDEGMNDDPRTRLFQLKDQLWRACRVVIDVKLQTDQMTFDEAVAMLVNVARLEHVNAVAEVRRYTQSATQPMSYLVGKHQIMELRESERRRLASGFRLRDFHDRLLAQGSLPVVLIEQSFSLAAEGG